MTHTAPTRIQTHSGTFPPPWSLRRPKPLWQRLYDLIGAPLRMIVLPDVLAERLHLTSLRSERWALVLQAARGRLLDIGAGDNVLIALHRAHSEDSAAADSVGVDVIDWGSGCVVVDAADRLPFPDESFDTVSFVACLNHIPERATALKEAHRVLRPGGRLIITMIGRTLGKIGHALWWYSEEKHRDVADGEEMGINLDEVRQMVQEAGFIAFKDQPFVYGLNHLSIATKPAGPL